MAKKSKKKQDVNSVRPVFWIAGNYYDCQKKWNKILSEYDQPPNIDVHDCSYNSESTQLSLRSSQANEIILAIKQDDMFDDRPRIIRLLGCPQDYAKIYDYLHYLDDNTKLVICGPIGYYGPAGSGVRLNSAKTSNFYKIIKEWDHVFEYPIEVEKDYEAIDWVSKVSKDLNIKIDRDAISLLIELKGRNLEILYGELCRMIDYDPKSKSINVDLVRKCCVPLFLKTTWDLIDSLDDKNYEDAISHLDSFINISGMDVGSSFYGDVSGLLSTIRQHFDFVLIIKSACGKNTSFDTAYKWLKDMKKPIKKEVKNIKIKTDESENLSDEILGEILMEKDSVPEDSDSSDKIKGKRWTYDTDMFSYGYMKTNFNKPSVQSMLNQDVEVLYNIVRNIYRCILTCRKNSGDRSKIRQSMTFLIMAICGKGVSLLE